MYLATRKESVAPPFWLQQPAHLAFVAKQALVAEAELTPKPGLVDRRGSGAHKDLSLARMRQSAEAIEPFFALMAEAARKHSVNQLLRQKLGAIGRDAETAMFAVTGGSNAHKGAIWVLGLLVAAAGQSNDHSPEHLAARAGSIARIPDIARPQLVSHGDIVQNRYGVIGARGEATAEFPHVVQVGLPSLRDARTAGKTETASRLSSLLSIMAMLDDTCILYRGGLAGAERVKNGAATVLKAGGPGTRQGDAALREFDHELLQERLSPGGSADLLAAVLFLDCLDSAAASIVDDNSDKEEKHGAD
jgi:triphosphoribosyl-dephospho-CoA synthase